MLCDGKLIFWCRTTSARDNKSRNCYGFSAFSTLVKPNKMEHSGLQTLYLARIWSFFAALPLLETCWAQWALVIHRECVFEKWLWAYLHFVQTTVQLIVLFMSSLRGVTFVFLNVHAVFVSRLPMGEIIFKEIRRD